MTQERQMIVTSALPYANGALHLGHLVEHVQTDIWVRAQRMVGNHCISICGDDAHGTPIMLKAQNLGITPEALTAEMKASHERDFTDFAIHYDSYHTTHSEENKSLASMIYTRLQARGDIIKKTISQAYDPEKKMFLPDRFVKGTCPKCKANDQYGDNCEVCGATYAPTDLLNPVSALSGVPPIEKESEHYFFDLPKYENLLKKWTKQGHLQEEVANKLEEWFDAGLKAWDISRDAPYFGFEIPGTTEKYFYVWLDAPIGYMASFLKYCNENGLAFDDFWGPDAQTELYHFVGKDIIYFHALFWPAMLSGADLRLPTAIYAHGFLTINGQKMSKSRGTFIPARTYLDHLDPQYLRYYYAAKLNGRVDDIDLNFEDFTNRVNADLVGKVVNIASRCAGFISKRFQGITADNIADPNLYQQLLDAHDSIVEAYLARDYARAVRTIMSQADRVNQYIDQHKPWQMAKNEAQLPQVQAVCSMGLQAFKILMSWLKPILPVMAEEAERFLNCSPLHWNTIDSPLLSHAIGTFKPLLSRIDSKAIEKMLESSRDTEKPAQAATPQSKDEQTIDITQFAAVDLRVGKIIEAEAVENADKLLRLRIDIGEETRQVFAGIKSAYSADALVGRMTIVVANLAPRKMRFGLSEGMVLAAGNGQDESIFLLSPDAGAQPGMKVK